MQTRTAQTVDALRRHLADHDLTHGAKLGTLKDLGDAMHVSRTVIREAVAILQAQKVLEVRHGVGIFVAEAESGSEHIGPSVMQSFSGYNGTFMDFLELRMAFEVHAAGLAASRRSWAQEEAIRKSHKDFEAHLGDDDRLDQLDFEFHAAIARATNNSAFMEFFDLMGARLLPQPALRHQIYPSLVTTEYLNQTVNEHQKICEMIGNQDAEGARTAMHAHLARSHERYRGLT